MNVEKQFLSVISFCRVVYTAKNIGFCCSGLLPPFFLCQFEGKRSSVPKRFSFVISDGLGKCQKSKHTLCTIRRGT